MLASCTIYLLLTFSLESDYVHTFCHAEVESESMTTLLVVPVVILFLVVSENLADFSFWPYKRHIQGCCHPIAHHSYIELPFVLTLQSHIPPEHILVHIRGMRVGIEGP
jgi:hypothetical protein